MNLHKISIHDDSYSSLWYLSLQAFYFLPCCWPIHVISWFNQKDGMIIWVKKTSISLKSTKKRNNKLSTAQDDIFSFFSCKKIRYIKRKRFYKNTVNDFNTCPIKLYFMCKLKGILRREMEIKLGHKNWLNLQSMQLNCLQKV